MKLLAATLVVMTALSLAPAASAETLLIQRVQAEQGATLPRRGASMAQVEAQFGVPKEKIAAVSGPGSLKHNPPITRWVYGNAVVYFENSHVVNAVLIKSSQLEMGPAPAR